MHISPDGAWIAFNGDFTGRYEVYVTPRRRPEERYQVSTEGGVQPRWSRQDASLFFLAADGRLMRVPMVFADGRAVPSRPVPVFQTGIAAPSARHDQYVPSSDGKRFLLLRAQSRRSDFVVRASVKWTRSLRP